MTNYMKLIICAFVSMLAITTVAPMTAHAGTLTIYNKNCTKRAGFIKKQRVTVHVFSKNSDDGCTNEWVVVHRGHTETIELVPDSGYGQRCGHYMHEAKGTVGGKYDVHGDETASITCKRDWAWVCQCTKD